MIRYSLFVLKVSLNANKPTQAKPSSLYLTHRLEWILIFEGAESTEVLVEFTPLSYIYLVSDVDWSISMDRATSER